MFRSIEAKITSRMSNHSSNQLIVSWETSSATKSASQGPKKSMASKLEDAPLIKRQPDEAIPHGSSTKNHHKKSDHSDVHLETSRANPGVWTICCLKTKHHSSTSTIPPLTSGSASFMFTAKQWLAGGLCPGHPPKPYSGKRWSSSKYSKTPPID